MKKFNDHESSHTHLEARMKWEAQGQPSLPESFSAEIRCSQQVQINALQQLSCLRFLLRQGLAVRGHNRDREVADNDVKRNKPSNETVAYREVHVHVP